MVPPLTSSSESIALRGLLEAIPDAALLIDPSGVIQGANEEARTIVGYGRAELVGRRASALVAQRYLDRLPLLRDGPRALGRPSMTRVEIHLLRKDGSEVPAELTLSPLETGPNVMFLAVMHPAPGSKGSEPAEVQRLKEMAEFRARFLNMAAHELKTPLTPIRMQVQLLQNYLAGAPDNVTHAIQVLSRSVGRLQNLMEDVLDAARLQASKLRLQEKAVSLSAIVREAVESYGAVATELHVELRSNIQPDVHVIGDHGRLLQVMNNLLSNGFKFTPAGGRLDVTIESSADRATIRVRDTGRGMNHEQLSKLFQPFTQVHPDVEATQKGTGLGLYITQGIVNQHGGSITIESPGEGQGTEVTVHFPLTTQHPVPTPPPKSRRQQQLSERLREMV